MNNGIKAFLLMIGLLGGSMMQAQQVKYFVAFTDKENSPYSLEKPYEFLGNQAILRRSHHNLNLDQSDLPVNPHYISQVKSIPNLRLMFPVKWLNGVLIRFESPEQAAEALPGIQALPFVAGSVKIKRSSLVQAPVPVVHQQVSTPVQASMAQSAYQYGGSFWQNRQLNVDCLHEQGFRGQGITIAVMDIGFTSVPGNPVFDSLRNNGNLLGTVDFVSGGTNAFTGGDHGTYVLSCMAANQPGLILGSAPMARYWLMRTEEGASETISEEYNWIRAAEFADSAGADILTTSLGYTEFDGGIQNHTYADLNGRSAPMSIAATMAARKGLFVINSAGNEGESSWRHIVVAADADSVCAVGAVDSAGTVADFSSVGPTPDGRIKPDLVARGAGAWVSGGNATCFPANGTSFSAPILAGAVACFWQKHRSYHNIQLMRILKRVASNASSPNNSSGWGIPNMCAEIPAGKPEFDFTVWADPGAQALRINIADGSYDYIKVSLYDLLGRTFYEGESAKNDFTIALSTVDMTDNVYLLKIETSEGTKIKKVIKQ